MANGQAVKMIRKITIKDCGAAPDIKKLISAGDTDAARKMDLLEIFGAARKSAPGETDKGPFIRFIGDFKAINLETGEVFRSTRCILPNFVGEQVWSAMKADASGKEVECAFGFRIGAHFDETAVTKYVYDVTPLLPIAENDAISMIEQAARSGSPLPPPAARQALPAPKPENKTTKTPRTSAKKKR